MAPSYQSGRPDQEDHLTRRPRSPYTEESKNAGDGLSSEHESLAADSDTASVSSDGGRSHYSRGVRDNKDDYNRPILRSKAAFPTRGVGEREQSESSTKGKDPAQSRRRRGQKLPDNLLWAEIRELGLVRMGIIKEEIYTPYRRNYDGR